MAITATDILFLLSGTSGNTDPNASLGGAPSTTQITSANLNNLFDQVSGAESQAGDVEYRGFYVKNNHGSLALQNARVFISSVTPASDTEIAIGLATEGVNVNMATIANESTAPAGVTWSAPLTYAAGLSLGNLPAGQFYGVWVRWTVNAGAAANASDAAVITVQGDTAA